MYIRSRCILVYQCSSSTLVHCDRISTDLQCTEQSGGTEWALTYGARTVPRGQNAHLSIGRRHVPGGQRVDRAGWWEGAGWDQVSCYWPADPAAHQEPPAGDSYHRAAERAGSCRRAASPVRTGDRRAGADRRLLSGDRPHRGHPSPGAGDSRHRRRRSPGGARNHPGVGAVPADNHRPRNWAGIGLKKQGRL